ncbi:MAG: DUF4349 domain-containing protein, partial [Anaerolineae bacterium]
MQPRKVVPVLLILLMVLLMAACAPAAATQVAPLAAPTMAPDLYSGAVEERPAATAAAPLSPSQPNMGAQSYGPLDQMIIKNAELRVLVADTDRALDGVTQVVTDVEGYVISSRVWYQDHFGTNYKYATLTIGVPVDQFEPALRRLRGLAVRVVDDTASGEDVTSQYVDLHAELG